MPREKSNKLSSSILTSNAAETVVGVTAANVKVVDPTPKRSKTELEELIIGEVSGRRCLWDKSNPNYKNTIVRTRNWREISAILSEPGNKSIIHKLV
jgi:hypothetical protein